MANSKSTPQDFIKDSFSPQIGVLCSTSAEHSCKKNNLSFIDLLEPFCRLNTELQYKDPNGATVSVRNLKISLVDVNTKPPHPTLARKYLNASVSEANIPRFQQEKNGDYLVHIPSSAPWFEAWRNTFFQVQYPADHEFTKHFLACMLVVSSNDPNPLDALVKLAHLLDHMQNISITKLPKWFNNNVLRYYVILHEENQEAQTHEAKNVSQIFEQMRKTYGDANCYLLRTNSCVPLSSTQVQEQLPDPWSQFLNNNRIAKLGSPDLVDPSSSLNVEQHQQSLEIGQEAMNEIDGSSSGGGTLAYHPLSGPADDEHEAAAALVQRGQQRWQQQQPQSPVLAVGEQQNQMGAAPAVLHGACLSTEDVEQIKLLVHEFCTRALVPYIERQVNHLSDLVTNKKGVSKSLFSATKRWFSPNKPTSNSATINTLTYPPDAPELHIRRLGDLYFMFGHYTMAYHAYHTAKRDFIADQAWLYYAGALEMAALAAFMSNDSTRKTFDYMEESITTYLTTCRMAQFAARATLFSSECLKGYHLHGEAAHQLIRMTSEESDLRSALLLEQASYCFLQSTKGAAATAMVRKYAFHMVLAGHRFSKASQRKHSLRCYKQAYEIYENNGWNLAQDHIHYTIGRQAHNLNELEEAVQSYAKLLTGDSKQSSEQQALFLKEYLTVHSSLLKKQGSLLTQVLPLPLVNSDSIRVLVGPAAPMRTPGKVPAVGLTLSSTSTSASSTTNQQHQREGQPMQQQLEENQQQHVSVQKWNKLEEMLVQEAQGSLPITFKPLLTLFTNNGGHPADPIAVIGEPIQVSLQLINPLQILLNLKDIYLLWQYRDNNNQFIAANDHVTAVDESNTGQSSFDHIMKTHIIKSAILQSSSTQHPNASSSCQEMILSVTPLAVGQVSLKGICYTLISSGGTSSAAGATPTADYDSVKQQLRGKQMFNSSSSSSDDSKTGDQRRLLDIKVVPSAPCLQVSFSEMNSELLRNEFQQISVELRNIGSVPLHKIYMATSMPHLLSSCEFQPATGCSSTSELPQTTPLNTISEESSSAREKRARKNHVSFLPLPPNDVLEPGQYHNVTIWMKAPELIGPASIDLLIYYENIDPASIPRYRLVRHVWQLSIQESIQVDASCQRSCQDAKGAAGRRGGHMDKQLTFTLKATNLNKIHHAISTEITILKAALLSQDWTLSSKHNSSNNFAPNIVKLESQESVYICLKACRRQSGGGVQRAHYSEVSLMQPPTTTPPHHEQVVLQQQQLSVLSSSAAAYLDFAQRDKRNMLNIFDSDLVTFSSGACASLPPSTHDDVTLILRWQAFVTDSLGKKHTVYGQNQIPINILDAIIDEEDDDAATVATTTPAVAQADSNNEQSNKDGADDDDDEQNNNEMTEAVAAPSTGYSFDRRLAPQLQADVGCNPQQADLLLQHRNRRRNSRLQHKLVYYNLVHPHAICHDFLSSKVCVVSLHLLVHNNVEDELIFKIETQGTSICPGSTTTNTHATSPLTRKNAFLYYPQSSNQFRWIQKGSIVQNVSALNTVQIRLSVAVLAPGTFDLGSRIEIWCYKSQDLPETAVLQTYRVQSSLIVAAAGPTRTAEL